MTKIHKYHLFSSETLKSYKGLQVAPVKTIEFLGAWQRIFHLEKSLTYIHSIVSATRSVLSAARAGNRATTKTKTNWVAYSRIIGECDKKRSNHWLVFVVLSKINDLRLREIRNITVGFSYPAKKRCGPQTSFFGCWLLKSGCHQTVDTVCNLRLINVILCLDLESRISFVTHRHSAGDHSHQSPKLQCPLLRLSVLCCQGGMSISLISGLPSPHRRTWLWKVRQRELCCLFPFSTLQRSAQCHCQGLELLLALVSFYLSKS